MLKQVIFIVCTVHKRANLLFQALLKISSAFLNRKIPNIPDIKVEGGEEKW
jgi:hypothetical protein